MRVRALPYLFVLAGGFAALPPGARAAPKSGAAPAAVAKALDAAESAEDDEDYPAAVDLYRKAAAAAKTAKRRPEQRTALEGLVRAATALRDYAAAYEAQKQLVGLGDAAKGAGAAAQAKLDEAVLAVHAGKLDEAAKLTEEADAAFEKAGDRKGRAKARFAAAIAAQRQTRYEDTVKEYLRSRAHSLEADDATEAARRLLDVGNVYKEFLQRYDEALTAYDGAIEELTAVGDAQAVREAEIDKGNLYLAAGRLADATSLLERVRMNQPRAQTRAYVRVTQVLANAYYRAGVYDLARTLADEALEEVGALPSEAARAPLAVDATNLKALIAAELGTTDAALAGFEAALKLAEKHGLKAKQSIVLNNIGYWLREAGRAEEARQRLEQARAIDKALRSDEGVAYDERNLGWALLAAGKAAEAKPLLEGALAVSAKHGMVHNAVAARVGLGTIALDGGDGAAAEALFRQAAEEARRSQMLDMGWRAHAGLAAALLKQGKVDEAFAAYDAAVAAVEAIEERLATDAAREGFKRRAAVAKVYADFEKALRDKGRVQAADRTRERAAPRPIAAMNRI